MQKLRRAHVRMQDRTDEFWVKASKESQRHEVVVDEYFPTAHAHDYK